MRTKLLPICLFSMSLLLAQDRAAKLSFGVKFRYSNETNVFVESGHDPFGKSIFLIETEGPSGRVVNNSLTPAEKARVHQLMQAIQHLSFSLPYKEQVLQVHGEAVSIEIHALSYQLTYTDSYDRAKYQRPIKELVKILKPLCIQHTEIQ